MAAIKKFFEKKKLEIKFKKAGSGHRLTDDTRGAAGGRALGEAGPSGASPRRDPTQDSRMAGQAALQRLSQPKSGEQLESWTHVSLCIVVLKFQDKQWSCVRVTFAKSFSNLGTQNSLVVCCVWT